MTGSAARLGRPRRRSPSSWATRARCCWSATAWAAPPPARSPSQMAVDSIYEALTAAEPQPRDGVRAARCAARSSAPTSGSSSSRATTRASAGWGPPARSPALVDDTLVVGADRRLALLRPARRQAGAGDQGPVAGLAAHRGGRDDARGGQGLRARQHHPAGAGRAGARRGRAVAGRRCARATSPCSAPTACTGRSATRRSCRCWSPSPICRRRARR